MIKYSHCILYIKDQFEQAIFLCIQHKGNYIDPGKRTGRPNYCAVSIRARKSIDMESRETIFSVGPA